MNWQQCIFLFGIVSATTGCSSLFDERTGPFRDKADDYKHANAGTVIESPETIAQGSIYEPLMPIPGESKPGLQLTSAEYSVDENGDAVPWTMAETQPAGQDKTVASSHESKAIATEGSERILHEPFFRVWHQAAQNAQEAGFAIARQDEMLGLLELHALDGVEDIPPAAMFSVSIKKLSDTQTKMQVLSLSEENVPLNEQIISIVAQHLS